MRRKALLTALLVVFAGATAPWSGAQAAKPPAARGEPLSFVPLIAALGDPPQGASELELGLAASRAAFSSDLARAHREAAAGLTLPERGFPAVRLFDAASLDLLASIYSACSPEAALARTREASIEAERARKERLRLLPSLDLEAGLSASASGLYAASLDSRSVGLDWAWRLASSDFLPDPSYAPGPDGRRSAYLPLESARRALEASAGAAALAALRAFLDVMRYRTVYLVSALREESAAQWLESLSRISGTGGLSALALKDAEFELAAASFRSHTDCLGYARARERFDRAVFGLLDPDPAGFRVERIDPITEAEALSALDAAWPALAETRSRAARRAAAAGSLAALPSPFLPSYIELSGSLDAAPSGLASGAPYVRPFDAALSASVGYSIDEKLRSGSERALLAARLAELDAEEAAAKERRRAEILALVAEHEMRRCVFAASGGRIESGREQAALVEAAFREKVKTQAELKASRDQYWSVLAEQASFVFDLLAVELEIGELVGDPGRYVRRTLAPGEGR